MGAAGTGNAWWWRQSLERFDQWYHFDRFAKAVEGIDPVKEQFTPLMIANDHLRIYALEGKSTLIAWCKDIHNDWQSEFEHGKKPELLENIEIDLKASIKGQSGKELQVYDPWIDTWSTVNIDNGMAMLPPFRRSIVFKAEL